MVGPSPNHCCSGKARMHNVCVLDLHVAANCSLSAAQKCLHDTFMSPAAMQIMHPSFLNKLYSN